MTPETKIKNKVKARLKEMEIKEGIWWTTLSQRYHSGLPDLMMIREGKTTFIEAKAPGKKLSPLQAWMKKRLVKSGADYWVVTEQDGKLAVLSGEDINDT